MMLREFFLSLCSILSIELFYEISPYQGKQKGPQVFFLPVNLLRAMYQAFLPNSGISNWCV